MRKRLVENYEGSSKKIENKRLLGKTYNQILDLNDFEYGVFKRNLNEQKKNYLNLEELEAFLTKDTINQFIPTPDKIIEYKNKNGKIYFSEKLYSLKRIHIKLQRGILPIQIDPDFKHILHKIQRNKLENLIFYYATNPLKKIYEKKA